MCSGEELYDEQINTIFFHTTTKNIIRIMYTYIRKQTKGHGINIKKIKKLNQ